MKKSNSTFGKPPSLSKITKFGCMVPDEEALAVQAIKSSHFAFTLELFDLVDPCCEDLEQVAKLNTRVFN